MISHALAAALRKRYGYQILWGTRFFIPLCCIIGSIDFGIKIYKAIASEKYISADATIQKLKVEGFQAEGPTTWTAHIRYLFASDANIYAGSDYDSFGPYKVSEKQATGEQAAAIAEKFKPGTHLTIWYDPQNPENSLVVKGTDPIRKNIQTILCVMVFGPIMSIVLWLIPSKKYKPTKNRRRAA